MINEELTEVRNAFQGRLAARSAAAAAERAALINPLAELLRGMVDPALFETSEQAAAAEREAEADLARAVEAHRRHAESTPTDRGAVGEWVAERTRLAGEVDGYHQLLNQAKAAARRAQQQLVDASRAAFTVEHQQRLAAWQERRAATLARIRQIEEEAEAAVKAEEEQLAEVRRGLDAWRQLAGELGVSLPELVGEERWRPLVGG